ncbi:hypothetical protein L6164_017382 [Bauhinia variegata]|uniref:Uncharacterized protein n=1 Tax=Bauhinia variegata TaxID=167791 RepID=A0ACB9N9A3_BAUVA|nr:hypothetical protein L6164_017382 [Bauhinia variegata]
MKPSGLTEVRSHCYTATPLAKYGVKRGFISNLIFTPKQTGKDGVKETGVSLGFTIHELDAGPIIASEVFQVDNQIKAVPTMMQSLIVSTMHEFPNKEST